MPPPPPPPPHHQQLHSSIAAVADHRPPPVSQRTRGSAMLQRQRREALEQEVSELKQQLSNEQTVHAILERALQQHPAAAAGALTNIPAKAKELLAELLLVEQEIARLEDQIHRMKHGRSAAAAGGAIVSMLQQTPPAAPPPEHCRSMFFITQAMDGEAYLSKVNKQEQQSSCSPGPKSNTRSPKNNNSTVVFAGLPPRHSLDNKQQQASSAAKSPNKLSERIVKCLVCIFMRLLRSSRASETHGNLSSARWGGSFSFSFSFRMDTPAGLANAAPAAKDKAERPAGQGQQDHYGVFAVPDAIVRDIGPYKNLVRFTSYEVSRGFSASPLVGKLREMLEALQQVDVRRLSHRHRLAFWINIYNTCIMHGILQHGLPSNPDKLLALKNKATINVSGQTFNALVIENFILRQPSSVKEEFWRCEVDVEEQAVREVYGLRTSEPNILFALCCGIRSSPALRIYKADRVVMDLEKAKLEYLQASLVVTSSSSSRRVMIPGLLHANMHDFAKDMESLLRWICDQLPTSWSLRKSMLDCLSRRRSQKSSSNLLAAAASRSHDHGANVDLNNAVDVIPLDYEFQYLLPM